ncbi:MAG: hypothetical protein L3K17_00230 [Thermoplasmata archaeon]|nr:hypothetical protein [Thermoplasmata archaeon]
MSLERLVDEIRQQAEAEISAERQRLESEQARLAADRDRRIRDLQAESTRLGELEIGRERAQRLARAKLEARKLVFEARERRMGRLIGRTRQVLGEFTRSEEYPALLKEMYGYAVRSLGKQVRVSGRAQDAALLKTVAGKAFHDTALPITGGLVVETSDGARRLDLSFDELLRRREDRVRELLAA